MNFFAHAFGARYILTRVLWGRHTVREPVRYVYLLFFSTWSKLANFITIQKQLCYEICKVFIVRAFAARVSVVYFWGQCTEKRSTI